MTTTIDPITALANHLSVSPDEITECRYDHYGMTVYDTPEGEYAVGTDEEADSAVADYIRDSAWAFRASFILSECGIPRELEKAIESFQSEECESANDAIVALIEKTCGMDAFRTAAIRADGRGHFLSSYDGNEVELDGDLYAFRIN